MVGFMSGGSCWFHVMLFWLVSIGSEQHVQEDHCCYEVWLVSYLLCFLVFKRLFPW